jgi:hypothetical protein
MEANDGQPEMIEPSSWPEIISEWGSLPSIFRDALPDDKPFPYIVYAPAQRHGDQSHKSKLVCLYQDRFTILEMTRTEWIVRTDYPFGSIQRIVHGQILLHAWFEVYGIVAGKRAISIIVYETVADHMFDPIIAALRKRLVGPCLNATSEPAARREFEFLQDIDLKLYRNAPAAVLPNEVVKQIVYQPEVSKRVLHLFRRVLIPNHILILTDKEIISVSDALWAKSRANAQFTYGVVKFFISFTPSGTQQLGSPLIPACWSFRSFWPTARFVCYSNPNWRRIWRCFETRYAP